MDCALDCLSACFGSCRRYPVYFNAFAAIAAKALKYTNILGIKTLIVDAGTILFSPLPVHLPLLLPTALRHFAARPMRPVKTCRLYGYPKTLNKL